METPALKFTSEAIGHLLEDRWLEVPSYQRPYAWDREHVAEFWSDLQSAMQEGRQYFLGAIVLTRQDARDHVIDGQQRLATASLLLAAIRDELAERNELELATHVEQQFLMRFNAKSRQSEPKLLLGAADAEFYVNRFVRRVGDEPTSTSQRRLTVAFDYLRTEVAQTSLDSGSLMAWVDLLAERVLIVLVEAASEADAFQIFETLNDRGAPLTLADLLKNYLMSLQPNEARLVGEAWDRTSDNLGPDSETQDLVTFLRHYWSSVNGATRERDLYKSLRTSIVDAQGASTFVENLARASEFYAGMLDPTHSIWTGYQYAPRAMETLVYLQLGQYRPLMLAALEQFTRDEVEALSEALVCWSVRGLVVGGIGGGTTERAYAAAGVAIREGKARTVRDVFNQLRPNIPTDEDFRTAFEAISLPRVRFGQYVMRSLNRSLSLDSHPALEDGAVAKGELLSLTYVVPRRANPQDWPGIAPDDISSVVNRVGNLALQRKSATTAPTGWDERREWLLDGDLPVNRSIAEYQRWTPDAIRRRQQGLAQVALSTWPRSGQVA